MRKTLTCAAVCLLLAGLCAPCTGAAQSEILQGHAYAQRAQGYMAYLNFREAIDYYEQAIDIFLDHLDSQHPLIAANYAAMGQAYLAAGFDEQARLYCETGLNRIMGRYPSGAIAANCLACLAEVSAQAGEPAIALAYFKKALAIHEDLWGPLHLASTGLYLQLGYFHIRQQQYPEAMGFFSQAAQLGMEENAAGVLGQAYLGMGQALLLQEEVGKGLGQLQRSLEALKEVHGESHPDISRAFLALAEGQAQAGDTTLALSTLDKAEQHFRQTGQQTLLIVGYDSCSCNPIFLKTAALRGAYTEKANPAVAFAHYEEAVSRTLRLIKYTAKSAAHRQAVLQKHKATFVDGIRLAHQLFKQTKDQGYFSKAFEMANAYQGLTLQIARKEAVAFQALLPDTDWPQRRQQIRQGLSLAEQRLYEARQDSTSSLNELRKNYTGLQNEYALWRNDFRRTYRFVEDEVFAGKNNLLSQVQAELKPNEALLNYVLDLEHRAAYLFAVKPGRQAFLRIPLDDGFSESVKQLYRLAQSALLPRADKKQKFVQKSQQLYLQLLAPLSGLTSTGDRLIIIRDDELHYLPFEVLLPEALPSLPFAEMPFAIRKHEMVYHYAAGLWLLGRQAPETHQNGKLLAFAPVFETDENGTSALADHSRCYTPGLPQSPLPYSAVEVQAIARHLGPAEGSQILLRQNATANQLLEALQQPFQFVHIASHSFANTEQPGFSGIACAPEEGLSDCLLYLTTIENLTLKADLVALSSCESGIGKSVRGEGVMGLNRSFMHAGVPNALFSLWKVNDQHSCQIMQHCYRYISEGMGYARALQQTKIDLITDGSYSTPNTWASFILMGR
ncbi:CHAT domain-containing protein [Phaeodactylibacter luteus]|uniref:CHAT domain-containing protein n=1 Tax=Phaeodactylibacter luteus TaxID=1564516 RepID=A0A5C6S701_9BACT|nr:CHAT domain-containing protein [Phaeodactylibacter luteus]TXB70179.1 CHAT domain-containing protein [Phaeodactylibacter luteus]